MKIYQLGTLLSNLASKANLSAINIEWLLFYLSVSRTNVFIDLRYDKLKEIGPSGVRALPLGCRHKRSGHSKWHYFSLFRGPYVLWC